MIRKQVLTLALSLGFGFLSGGVAAASLYTVSSGDTLYAIAKTHKVSVSALQNLNNLRSHRIVPGQKIKIPGTGGTEANPTADMSYTVRRGDSLGKIATNHRVSLSSLKQNNRLRSNIIHPGQILFIPNGKAASTTDFQSSGTATVHVVARGDSLWEISKRYRISMASLSSFNGLAKNPTLVPGQQIRIPAAGSLNTNPVPSLDSYTGYASNGVKYPFLESQSVIVVDAMSGKTLLEKNIGDVKSIASITKLMTAMVTLDAKLPLDEVLTINREDVDRLKMTGSRLPLGTKMTREEMLHLALMSSENRAASALSRHYPGGQQAFTAF